MTRVSFFALTTAILVGLGTGSAALGADSPDPFDYVSSDSAGFEEYRALVQRLDADGAQILVIEKTFLGRVRILSVANGLVREVIISPNTGEIRRDIILGAYNPADYPAIASAGNHGKAKGKDNGKAGENGKGNGKSEDKGNNGRGK